MASFTHFLQSFLTKIMKKNKNNVMNFNKIYFIVFKKEGVMVSKQLITAPIYKEKNHVFARGFFIYHYLFA